MTDKIVMVFAIAGVNCVKVKRLVRVMDYGPKDLTIFLCRRGGKLTGFNG